MPIRSAVFIMCLFGLVLPATAAEVSSIVSCKRDGEFWLCAAWRQGQIEVFRSETYITGVEFDAPPVAQLSGAEAKGESGRMAANEALPRYTLQLLACRISGCVQKTGLHKIKNARVIEQRRNGKLWHLLVIGEYASTKAAQKAAADLISKHKLRDKPWIRTLDSLQREAL